MVALVIYPLSLSRAQRVIRTFNYNIIAFGEEKMLHLNELKEIRQEDDENSRLSKERAMFSMTNI